MKPDLLVVIRAARRRWRLRVLLHGMAWVGVGGLVTVLVGAWGVDHFRFSAAALAVFRALAWGTIAGLFAWRVVRPLARRITDEQVALYLEEHETSLDGAVLGAMAAGRGGPDLVSPSLMDRIVARAVERLEQVERGRRIERPTLQRSGGVLAAVAAVSVGAWLLGPGSVRTGLPFVVSPFRSAAETPYAIDVQPGDSTAARGADLRVRALLRNFTAEDVTLVLRPRGAQEWERVSMQRAGEGEGVEYLLFDLRDTTEYFVTAGGVRSPVYRLAVVDLPYVETISLLYTFPAYSGLEPVREEDGGDIAALVGTRVRVEVVPTITASGGALLVGADTIPFAPGETPLAGEIEVRESGSYRVLLAGPDGRLAPASREYFIDALEDQPPVVRISEPGRDVSVTSVDELFAEVTAEDDFGLRRVELVYTVNGGADVTRELYGGRGARKDVTAGHTLYLEEMSLVPGDVIAYYARAVDARRNGEPAVTDIYFVTIRPFDRQWRAADERGAPGGEQGGGASPGELSNRQRDIIAATFRLVRDRARFTEREWLDNLGTVTLMQGRLREEVQTLLRRFETRGVAELDTTLATVAAALPQAAEAMVEAEERLGRRMPDSALSPEQRALQQLQRAEAAFRERQVQLGQQGGGGGGGGASAEELADLFDLEMDRLRNQYESVERGQQRQTEQQTDEALEKLRELARRQQQENERQRARAAGDQAAGGAEGQRRLAEEAEELGRRLERLSREQRNPELGEAARRLQGAANAMRQAAAGQRGTAQGEAAAERLRDAQRRLEESRGAGQQRDLEDALRRAERLVEQQDEVRSRMRELPADPTARQDGLRQLSERKDAMAEEVDQLESELDRLARDTHGEQPDASERLRAAVKDTRDKRLQDKIRYSRGVMAERSSEYAEAFEESIAGDLEALRDGIADAAGRMGEPEGRGRERVLDQARDVARALESLGERAREGSGTDSAGGAGRAGGRERQLRDEMGRRAGELRELRDAAGREGMDTGPLEEIARRLDRMDASGAVGTPRGLEQLAEAIQALKDFEFALRRELMAAGGAPPVLRAGEDIPPEYRAAVEEYYRRLAERRR